ncbi:hypothetical protein RhiirC2_801795 [Rhizophagus irregularis]|uniref:Uncharacterized protein n=1 Tax=Rhizophagus irregularis TaxID=588596 RepID=A0A2N1M250_9GLOM|nr:hypothetical protein RhiirC2_801795 [Rhizophagus irregularis]
MAFNQAYFDLLAKLPAFLINEAWIHFTSQKRKPLSEKEASEINPIVESFLKHEAIYRYQKRPKVGWSVRHLYLLKKYQLYTVSSRYNEENLGITYETLVYCG